MRCPKCGGLSWEVIREGGSEWKHCLCGKAWDFKDFVTDYFHKKISIPLKDGGGAMVNAKKGPKEKITEKPTDGCTYYTKSPGYPPNYCDDPRKPGSSYCEHHWKWKADKNSREREAPAPAAPKPQVPPEAVPGSVPVADPAPPPRGTTVTVTGSPEFIRQAIIFLEGRITEYENDIQALKQSIETLQKVS